jgi:hypothetical protein
MYACARKAFKLICSTHIQVRRREMKKAVKKSGNVKRKLKPIRTYI